MNSKNIENGFEYRAYGKGELAMLYTPCIEQGAAVRKMNEWIERVPGLKRKLENTGLSCRAKRYTPVQVRLIVEGLGEP